MNLGSSERTLARARQYSPNEKLTPEEFDCALDIESKLLGSRGVSVLVLGNYDKELKPRLFQFQKHVNQYGDAKAYLMEDFTGWKNTDSFTKFQLLADFSNHIVVICENDQGGVLLEQAILLVANGGDYMDKSYMLKRLYPEPAERERYSAMQPDVFRRFDYKDRLYEWGSCQQFEGISRRLAQSLVG